MYIGRFAPTPTGPLHFGSLLTAVASYADAKANQGKWLLRIDDIDSQRSKPAYIATILQQLKAYQLLPDAVVYQSARIADYADALQQLQAKGLTYFCQCSRQQLGKQRIYPQHCLKLALSGVNHHTRLHIASGTTVQFSDHIQGVVSQALDHSEGDMILKRREGIYNYPLAVVVDDHLDRISHVVRGADLLEHTPGQIWLGQQLYGQSVAHYAHIPLAMQGCQQKLSKQNQALPIAMQGPQISHNLQQVAAALQQAPLQPDTPARMLAQLVSQWSLQAIPASLTLAGIYT